MRSDFFANGVFRGTNPHRHAIAHSYLDGARYVARMSDSREAREISRLLDNCHVVCSPIVGGIRPLPGAANKPNAKFRLVPVIPEDVELDAFWADIANPSNGGMAVTIPEFDSLVVKEACERSLVWKGVILLHEGFHLHRDPRKCVDFVEKSAREVRVRQFEHSLCLVLGGKQYKDLLSQFMVKISADMEVNPATQEAKLSPHKHEPNPLIDTLFGFDALSEQEKRERSDLLWTHAAFEVFHDRFGDHGLVSLMMKLYQHLDVPMEPVAVT